MLRCDCIFCDEKNAGKAQEMYFRSNVIFDDEQYRRLITVPTSNDRICLAKIKRDAKRNITREINSDSQSPPVEVELNCVDKITIDVKVMKTKGANDENAL